VSGLLFVSRSRGDSRCYTYAVLKPPYILVIVVVVVFAYLYAANAYIYYRIAHGYLPFPDTEHSYSLGNPDAPHATYVALGDSLTAGVGTDSYTKAYPYLLATKLAAKKPILLKDLAYPGSRSQEVIDNFLNDAIAQKPDIVTLMIGTNDIHDRVSAAQFEKNYRFIIETLKTKTDAKIYLLSIPYIGTPIYWPPYNYYFDYKVGKFNGIIERIAADYEITYIDVATPTREILKENGLQYAADEFHPTAVVYSTWSDILYASINR
jgi:lysophospholipase L1-like esterase